MHGHRGLGSREGVEGLLCTGVSPGLRLQHAHTEGRTKQRPCTPHNTTTSFSFQMDTKDGPLHTPTPPYQVNWIRRRATQDANARTPFQLDTKMGNAGAAYLH
jgi:hypothetical protein